MSEARNPELGQEMRSYYSTSRTYLDRLKKHDEDSFESYIELCERELPEGSTVLDCGCGVGLSSYLLAQRGFEVTGTDISSLFISEAIRNHGDVPSLKYQVEDASGMTFSDRAFDAVGAYDLVEHVPDVEGTVKEICRVARSTVIILQANRLNPFVHLAKCFRWKEKNEYTRWEPRSRREAPFLFIKNGAIALSKALGLNKKIYYLEPILSNKSDRCGRDFDTTWLSNSFDIKRLLEENGFRVREKVYVEFEDELVRRLKRLKLYRGQRLLYLRIKAPCMLVARRQI